MEQKFIELVTPLGIGGYMNVFQPDRTYDNYKAMITLTPEDKESFEKELDAAHEEIYQFVLENGAKAKDKRKARTPEFKETEDGNFTITFSTNTIEKNGKPPLVVDAKGKAIGEASKLGAGSTIRLSVLMFVAGKSNYGVGSKTILKGVQVKDLVEFTGGGGGSAFGVIEGGYEASSDDALSIDDGDDIIDDIDDGAAAVKDVSNL